MLFLFEYRAAILLIKEQFPGAAAALISNFEIDGDVISLDGRDPLRTDSEVDTNGRIHVRIRRSTSSAPESAHSSSLGITPRPSNLSGAEIFSIRTPGRMPDLLLPGDSDAGAFGHFSDTTLGYRSGTSPRLSGYASSDAYSLQPTPRASNFNEMDLNVGTTVNTPTWVRSPVAGQVLQQQSPVVVPGMKMLWNSSLGKYQARGDRHVMTKDVRGTYTNGCSYERFLSRRLGLCWHFMISCHAWCPMRESLQC